MIVDLNWKGAVVGIPYGEWTDAERGTRHEFVDLRRHPDRLAELPEPAKWPELRDALASINAADGAFRTFGCEGWGPIAGAYPAGLTQRVGTYVQVAFADPQFARSELNYHTVAALFFRHCQARDKAEPVTVDIDFEQYLLRPGDEAGHCLTWWVNGFGADFASARAMMNVGLAAVCDHLRQLSRPSSWSKIDGG